MWLGPALFAAVSVFLWKYVGAVFMPELLARPILAILPAGDMERVILINASILYFGAYFAFVVYWGKLKRFLRNPFLAGLSLWLLNVLVLFPVFGKGILGYRMPQGWLSASLPLFVAHWVFARGLQFQARRQ
jgi:hypothetical protein